jgi:hypothetical protein
MQDEAMNEFDYSENKHKKAAIAHESATATKLKRQIFALRYPSRL